MIERFKEDFNFNPNGALRNWKILDDKLINKQFANSYAKFKSNLECLDEALIFTYNGTIIFKTEETNKLK